MDASQTITISGWKMYTKVNTEIVPNNTHVSKFHHTQHSNGPEKNLLQGRLLSDTLSCYDDHFGETIF